MSAAQRAAARRLRGALLLALAAALSPARAGAEPGVEAEGAASPLLAAAERAAVTATGTIRQVERLDPRGFSARFEPERVLAGVPPTPEPWRIAWEESAPERPPRFAEGERILVALEPLPTASIWRQRFPAGDALAVAAKGRAALKEPDAGSVDALARYLALPQPARAAGDGDTALFALAAEGALPLAEAALGALGARPNLDARLGEDARERFARLLGAESRPLTLRSAALALAGSRRLASLRAPIEAHAQPGDPLEAAAREALAALDGGLAPEQARALLARDDASLRSLALRFGSDAISDAELADRARSDPAREVRLAAADALLARRGKEALDVLTPMLLDRDPELARETALRVARLGDAAVPELRKLFAERPYTEVSELSTTALALALSGPSGVVALEEIAAGHPDEKRRKLANLALGRLGAPGHKH